MIRYAGYDPTEAIDDLNFPPDIIHLRMPPKKPMDAQRAKRLRSQGLSLKEVGERLAEEEGRKTAYLAGSVYNAIKRRAT